LTGLTSESNIKERRQIYIYFTNYNEKSLFNKTYKTFLKNVTYGLVNSNENILYAEQTEC